MKQTLRIFMLLAVALLTAGQVWARGGDPVKFVYAAAHGTASASAADENRQVTITVTPADGWCAISGDVTAVATVVNSNVAEARRAEAAEDETIGLGGETIAVTCTATNVFTLTLPADVNKNVRVTVKFHKYESVSYINAEGVLCDGEDGHPKATAYVLDGSENTIAEGWYVADGEVSFNHQLTASGDVHIILKDGAVMNIGTVQSPVSGHGIHGNGHSVSIYAQSTGDSKGKLLINASWVCIFAEGGNVGIYGGDVTATGSTNDGEGIFAYKRSSTGGSITLSNATVTASGGIGIDARGGLTINSGTVTANGKDYGIQVKGSDLTIKGGKVTATGTSNNGIYAYGGNVVISGGEVEATGGGGYEGIFAYKSGSTGGSITLSNATVTASGVSGIHAKGGITINSGTITANGNKGIYANGCDLTIKGGKVTATGTSDNGIYAYGGNVVISGGEVEATGGGGYDGIYATKSGSTGGSITLSNATVTASGSVGIEANGGSLTAENCTIIATGTGRYGTMSTGGNTTFTSCEVMASGGDTGIYTNNSHDIVINGGEVEATGTSEYGIYASNGSVSVKDATITAGGVYATTGITFDGSSVTVSGWCYNASSGDIIIKNGSSVTSMASGDRSLVNEGGSISINGSKVDAKRRIEAKDGVSLTNATVTVEESNASNYAIYATNNGLTIDGSTVTTTGKIFAEQCDISICNGSKVIVTGDIYVGNSSKNLSINNSEVEFTGQIFAGKNLTIDGSKVMAFGNDSGEIFTVYGAITLGWSHPDDCIYAKTYGTYDGSVVIAEGKTFIAEDGNTYSGTMDKVEDAYPIDGKTLRPYNGGPLSLTATTVTKTSATLSWTAGDEQAQWVMSWSTDNGSTWSDPVTVDKKQYELTGLSAGRKVCVEVKTVLGENEYSFPATISFYTPIDYLDISGTTQTCSGYTVFTGSETTLAAGWYVADGEVSFNQQLTASGDVHIILKDGAVMSIGTAQSPVSGHGIYGNGHSISIYAQSTGDSKGKLQINASQFGIFAEDGNVGIYGGEVTATGSTYGEGIFAYKNGSTGGSITLSNATVTASGGMGIDARGGLTINSGTVTANGSHYGIQVMGSDLTIKGGKVTATSTSDNGIFASGGNVVISGGEVEATGGGGYDGIRASKYNSNGGNITLGWTAPTDFINASRYSAAGTITLTKDFTDSDGEVYSGTVSASAINGKTLRPYNGPRSLTVANITKTSATLSWTAGGEETQWRVSLSADNGSTWSQPVTVDENQYVLELTGLSAGTAVRVKVESVLGEGVYSAPATITFGTPIDYLDISGTTQTCTDYTVLTGSETTLAAGWYVADGEVSFNQLTASGDVHIILKDGSAMSFGSAQSPVIGHGIYGNGHSISIYAQSTGDSKGKLLINASQYGIFAEGGNVGIYGGEVTATGNNGCDGIFAYKRSSTGGSITLSNATVTASGVYGIDARGGLTINSGTVTANGSHYGIQVMGSDLTIKGGKVTATGTSNNGIYASGVNVEISGGEVEATGGNGIFASNGSVSVTDATITAGGVYAYKGITFDGSSVTVSGVCYNASSGDIIIKNGSSVTSTASGDGSLGNDGGSISISGSEVDAQRLIRGVGGVSLTNAIVKVEESDASIDAIYAVNNGLTIDGSTVTTTGEIFAEQCDISICNGSKVIVTGGIIANTGTIYHDLSISNSEVEFTNQLFAGKNLTIDGSKVTAIGNGSGKIHAEHGVLTLGWSNPDDCIYAKTYGTYDGSVVIAEDKTFIDGDGNTYSGTIAKVGDAYPIDGKTLRPYIAQEITIGTSGWATWCSSKEYTLPEGLTAYTVSGLSADGKSVVLTPVETIMADTPLLLKGTAGETYAALWSADGEATGLVSKPVGNVLTFYGNPTDDVITTGYTYEFGKTYVLYQGEFVLVDSDAGLPAHKCLLTLTTAAARQLTMSIGDETTGITTTNYTNSTNSEEAWYGIDGRKLQSKPAAKGLYIYKGKKRIVR